MKTIKSIMIMSILMILISTYLGAATLEESAISDKDKSEARNIRDKTRAPNSLVGNIGEAAAKNVSEGMAAQGEGCSAGKCKWVTVSIDGVWGLWGPGPVEKFTLSNMGSSQSMESPGYIRERLTSTSSISIHAGYNGNIAGTYRWSAKFGRGSSALHCGNTIYVSGTKERYSIRVYNDCRDAGSHEN